VDDKRCRVTVVGERRRVDLAVPAAAPIAEYLPDLIRDCGQSGDETLPPAWSLARAGGKPFSLDTSLLDAQIADGETLYLRDLLAGEADGPLVTELEDSVVEENGRRERWSGWHGALTAAVLGLIGYLVVLGAMVLAAPASPLPGALAAVSGSSMILAAGLAARKGWPMPHRLRAGLAFAGVPALALAGYALPVSRAGANAAAVATTAGAAAGAAAVLLAVVSVWTLAAALVAATALPVVVLLAVLDAGGTERAAVVVVVALLLLALGPAVAGRLAALPQGRSSAAGGDVAGEAAAVLVRGRRLLAAWASGFSVVAACCLVVLSGSDDPFALGLVACVGIALIGQAGHSTVPWAVGPVLAAGVLGLVALGVRAPSVPWLPEATWLLLTGASCVVLAVVGLVRLVDPPEETAERPGWTGSLASVLSVLSVPLAVGVFGAYAALVELGAGL